MVSKEGLGAVRRSREEKYTGSLFCGFDGNHDLAGADGFMICPLGFDVSFRWTPRNFLHHTACYVV